LYVFRFLSAVDGDNALTILPRKKKINMTTRRHSGTADFIRQTEDSGGDNPFLDQRTRSIDSSPVLVINPRNKNRQIQTSLERLERENDELFQL